MGTQALAFIRRDFQTEVTYRLVILAKAARLGGLLCAFYFISKAIDDATGPHLAKYNADYFHYVLLGLAFYPFIKISLNSMAEVVQQYQQTGTMEMLCLSPTPLSLVLLMSTLWRYMQALFESVVYLSIAALVLGAQILWGNMLIAVGVILLAILANVGIGFIGAAVVLITKRASPFIQFFSMLTILFSGMYFPTEVLPWWVQRFSYILPATYAFSAIRNVLLANESITETGRTMFILAGFGVVLIPIGLIVLNLAIRWTKVDGSLSQY